MIGWDIFMNAPILGHGPGSFHILSAVNAAIPPGFYQVHAHNLVLQVLGESGLIGFILFSAIVIRTITLIIRGWRRSDQNKKDLIASTAVLVGMMTHHFVDFAFEVPLYTIGFFFVLANISQLECPSRFSINSSIAKNSLILVLIISFGIGSVFTLRGAQLQYQGALAAQAGNWEQAQTYICLAQKQNTRLSLFNFQCGFTSAVLTEELDENQFLSIASQAYQEGLGKDPYWPYHRATSASVVWTLGAREEALGMMVEAQSQAPRSSILALNLAWMYAEIGHADLSKSYLSLAYELNPWLWRNAQSPWKPTGEALDPANLEKLQTLMSRSGYHSLLGWLYIDTGELEKAKDAFRSAIENDPSAVDAYAGYALLALMQGNSSEATRMIKVAQLTGGRSPRLEKVKGDLAFHLGEINQAHEHWIESVRQYLWTSSMGIYYPVVYNRAFISIDFPPQMVQPTLPTMLADEFQQALNNGSPQVIAEAIKLLPWFENQIHLRSE
jgi:tetratricopeptide (TPR) repeat protein